MDEKAIRQYISQTIESEGYTIRSDAFDLLLQLTDLNLSKIMGELQKLYLYALETKTITRGAVQELVPKSLEHNVFDLTNVKKLFNCMKIYFYKEKKPLS